jgi:hypothetical protein
VVSLVSSANLETQLEGLNSLTARERDIRLRMDAILNPDAVVVSNSNTGNEDTQAEDNHAESISQPISGRGRGRGRGRGVGKVNGTVNGGPSGSGSRGRGRKVHV